MDHYQPQSISSVLDVPELARYTLDELAQVARITEQIQEGRRDVRNLVPSRPEKGQLAYADGVNWNPGQGAGLYFYTGAAWIPAYWPLSAVTTVTGGVGFQNAWVDYGAPYGGVAYSKNYDGWVSIEGVAKNGTLNVPMFTLPAGYRPLTQRIVIGASNGALGIYEIFTNGDVKLQVGNNTYASLEFGFRTT